MGEHNINKLALEKALTKLGRQEDELTKAKTRIKELETALLLIANAIEKFGDKVEELGSPELREVLAKMYEEMMDGKIEKRDV